MKTMTIRDLPEDLHARLKERAKRNRRSLNQQVIADLSQIGFEESPGERAARVEREVRESEALRARVKGFLTAEEIDTAKRQGLA
ncbi:MAG: hypothetical protein EA425_15280 [Puniceicoccaceae bacterium]|nr:MAG: hypothetical protein EA425_15280 [Puniceicoccaceae bacterium]